jgi:hypothetical protein
VRILDLAARGVVGWEVGAETWLVACSGRFAGGCRWQWIKAAVGMERGSLSFFEAVMMHSLALSAPSFLARLVGARDSDQHEPRKTSMQDVDIALH